MKNPQYLISVVEASRRYGVPRDKLYAEIRSSNTEIPYIKIGNTTKINSILLEKLLDEKSLSHGEL